MSCLKDSPLPPTPTTHMRWILTPDRQGPRTADRHFGVLPSSSVGVGLFFV